MNGLTIEPTYRVLLGETTHIRILQVGCGGTGSALALALGGLAHHARQKGIRVELTLVDHNVIEPGNVGRQNFAAASALTTAVPKCVDLAARQAMARTALAHDGGLWLMSCGNERVNGQVLLGNTGRPETIRLDKLGLCTGLPYPYLQEPGLLAEAEEATAVSCAVMAQQEAQSLMVNRLVAAVAGHLITEMVLQRQVTVLGCYFSLAPPVMRSVPVTAATLAPFRLERQSD